MSDGVERAVEDLAEMRNRRSKVENEQALRMIGERALQQGDSGHRLWVWLAFVVLLTASFAAGWQQKPGTPSRAGAEFSGMYSFLREGEFVQITLDSDGAVSGFVARYGDLESDKGILLDHFFKTARLNGNRLAFTTDVVHGIAFSFTGTFSRGANKKPGEEGYYSVEGNLTETATDDNGKPASRERGITLKSLARKSEMAVPSAPAH